MTLAHTLPKAPKASKVEENIVYFMGPYTDTVSEFDQVSHLVVVHD